MAATDPADAILRAFDEQGSASAAPHPADAILRAYSVQDTPPPANINAPLAGGATVDPAPAVSAPPADDGAPRQPGNFHPMPDALAAPIAAAKQAFGDAPIIPAPDDPRLGVLAVQPGQTRGAGNRLLALVGRDALGAGDLVARTGAAGVSAVTAGVGNLAKEFGMSDTNANKLVGDLNLEALRRGTDLNSPQMMPADVAPNKLAAAVTPSVSMPNATAVVQGTGNLLARGVNSLTGRGFGPAFEAQLAEARGAATPDTTPPQEAPAAPSSTTPPAAPPAAAAPIVPPDSPAPAPAPVPQSVGAAATTPNQLTDTAMSPKEAAAAQATSENYRLAQGAAQGPDDTVYVPGVQPTLAETMGHAGVSLQQKQISGSDLTGSFVDQERRNNDARVEHVESLAGTPTIVNAMEQARSDQASTDLQAAFANKQAVDAQPVVDQINAVLAGRGGKVTPIADAMKQALAPLYDSNGTLEADPELLYGARQQINYLLSKTAQQEKPGLREATSQLTQVKGALDQVIEQGAPGYQQYLKNYATASGPIDAANLLQDWVPKLKDANGNITLNRVNTMMKQIVAQRQGSGVNAAKSIDEPTMEGLWNLRSDLLRKGNLDLGKARGSDTAANRTIGESMGLTGAHLAASHIPGGNMLLENRLATVKGNNLAIMRNRLLDGTLPPYEPMP